MLVFSLLAKVVEKVEKSKDEMLENRFAQRGCSKTNMAERLEMMNREGEAGKKSPVLNKDTTKVGISNKAHKKTKNLIQVLYVKMTVNALD